MLNFTGASSSKNMILSLEKSIYVLAFFITSLLSSKGISFSITSVDNNTFLLAINVGKITRLIDLKTLPFPSQNEVSLFSFLTDCWSSFLKDCK